MDTSRLAADRVEVAWAGRSAIGESPYWDAAHDAVVWVDIGTRKVCRLEVETGRYRSWQMTEHIGAAVPRRGGGMVVALGAGFAAFDPEDGSLSMLAPLDLGDSQVQLNDCQCDRHGRIWGGTQGEPPRAAHLYRLDAGHGLTTVLDQVTVSNGIGWSPDDRSMYYVDSRERRIDVFDFDVARGTVNNRRPLVHVPDEAGVPDGLCVDSAGMIWVALWGGGAVRRYRPDGGLDRVLPIPAANVTSCAFGGADLSTLYVTTAAQGMTESELEMQPAAGALLAHRPGVHGQRPNAYAG